jgi:hypothetical protein
MFFLRPPGQLLGFLVSARGIEANPEKIHAILCNIPSFYRILEFFFVCIDWNFVRIKNLLSLFKSFIIKTISNFLLFLTNSFEKIEFQNTILHLFKHMQAYLHMKYLQNGLY